MSAGWASAPIRDEAVAAQLADDLAPEDWHDILAAYGRDIRHRAEQLAAALREDQAQAAYEAVHSLKGASLNLGFLRLGALCAHLQILAQTPDLATMALSWPAFVDVCNASLARLGDSGLAFETDSSIVRL